MTIDDQIGSDGVLRALLSEQINNKSYPVYPKTHSDVVTYENTTVKFKLDSFTQSLTNIQAALQDATREINNVIATSYDKEYISGALGNINDTLSANGASIIELRHILNTMSYYTQPQLDQRFYNLQQDVTKSINNVNTIVSELSAYVNSSFSTDTDLSIMMNRISKMVTEYEATIRTLVEDDFRQLIIDTNENLNTILSDYDTRAQSDSKLSIIRNDVSSLTDDLSTFRGDVITMNTRSENNVNSHMDAVKQDILLNNNNKLIYVREAISDKINSQTSTMNNQYNNTMANIGSLGTMLDTKLGQIIGQLNSMGATIPASTYQSADGEVY